MLLTIVTTASHVAHLDTTMGTGLLVMADMTDDVWMGTSSLLEADYHAMLGELDDLGYSLASGDDGEPWHVCVTMPDGRDVVTLAHRDVALDEDDLDDIETLARSSAALRKGLGLVA